MQQHFDIPDNIARYVDMYDGVKLNIQVSTRVLNSYIRQQTYTVIMTMRTRRCKLCGFDLIWNPFDDESPCRRHTYEPWRDDPVFVWSPGPDVPPLEEAFDEWLAAQPKGYGPVKMKAFGRMVL